MRTLPIVCSAFVLASGLLALPAAAATLTISSQGSNIFGSNGNSSVTITEATLRPGGIGVLAGGFAVTGNLDGVGAAENFIAWCLDISTTLRLPSTYTTTTTPFASGPLSPPRISTIERLFETGLSTLNLGNNADSAGFQLALWEVLYENSGTLSLGTGNFSANHATAAIAVANTLLGNLALGPVTRDYNLTFLQSNDPHNTVDGHYSQHLVTATPVPLPAGGVLLLAGLGALGALRRRARKAA